ncbi:MAG: ABC transporter ATP-binding protein [Halanaerobium sp.]
MSDHQNILEIKNLSVIYNLKGENVKAVDNVSIKIKEGTSIGLIGESGSGKTSLALSIMGLIKKAELTGEIIYKNKDLLKLKNKDLKKYRWQKIAVVFQSSLDVLNPVLTIKEQIAETINTHEDLPKNKLNEKIDNLLEMVNLDSKWKDYYPHHLSGGMRQKVLIAMALACEPEFLIVDEPATSLDSENKKEIVSLLNNLREKHNLTMLIISHDLKTIKKLSSKLITMYKGNFVEYGITEEVISKPKHCYTRGLINSSPALFPYKDLWGIKAEEDIIDNDGCPFYSRCPQHKKECKNNKAELKYIGVERMVACNRDGIINILEAYNLSKTFIDKNLAKVEAVKKADINIRSGEIAALVGKSGSGKSTLAQLLAGIEKKDSGKIIFMNQEISQNLATAKMGGIQIIFQDPFSATSDRLSVLEVVKEPLEILKWANKEKRIKKAVNLIKSVQLPTNSEFINRSCRNLSGGQRQRIAIARALVTEPKLLIADEITSMLDPSVQANIIRQLKELQNKKGFSMLFITHNLDLARKISDKAYLMEAGEIIKEGLPSELFDKDMGLKQSFLKKAFI